MLENLNNSHSFQRNGFEIACFVWSTAQNQWFYFKIAADNQPIVTPKSKTSEHLAFMTKNE